MPVADSRNSIFIAEDDPSILELLTLQLRKAGYTTCCAHDGIAALERLEHERPWLVILDVNMPRLDGFGVLRAMRQKPHLAGTPVLMLTARTSAVDVRKARELGASDYLAKPFEARQLLQRVERLAKSRPGPKASNEVPPETFWI